MGSRNRFEQLSVRSRQGRRLGRLGRAGAGLLLVLGFAGALAPLVQTVTSAPAGAQTNLIQNGNFEAPALPSGTNFDTYPGGSTAITDWTVGANSVDVVGSQYLAPEDGAQSIELSAGGSVSQNVAGTTAGDTYALSWYVAGDPTCVGDPHPTKTMDVSWNGTLVADPSFNTAGDSPTSPGWAEEQVDVTATRIRHHQLRRRHGRRGPVRGNPRQRFARPDGHDGLRFVQRLQRQLRDRHLALGLLADGRAHPHAGRSGLRRRQRRHVDRPRPLVQRQRHGHAGSGGRPGVHRHRVGRRLPGTVRFHDDGQGRPVRRQRLRRLPGEHNRRRGLARGTPLVERPGRRVGERKRAVTSAPATTS